MSTSSNAPIVYVVMYSVRGSHWVWSVHTTHEGAALSAKEFMWSNKDEVDGTQIIKRELKG